MTNVLAMPVKDAKLPAVYERAKEALEKCSSIDECADWKNKAEAIASYARQAKDDALLNTATRIKARAIRRCGQLLEEIKPAKGTRTDLRPKGGAPPKLTRTSVAAEARLSNDQRRQALRVAAVPERDFESAVESDEPATVTALADRGKGASTAHLHGRDPADFAASTKAQGALRHFFAAVSENDPKVTVRGALPHEMKRMLSEARAAVAWLNKLLAELEKKGG